MIRLISVFIVTLSMSTPLWAKPCVILLHGISGNRFVMGEYEENLLLDGFQTVNQAYPSRSAYISELSETAIPEAISKCEDHSSISFVTHSMGGILVRDYYARHKDAKRPDAVVMLAPPNQGSQVVDSDIYALADWWNGPAGPQLSAKEGSFVKQLPPVDFPLGVIAGNQSIEPYTMNILPGPDDGKVSVEATKIEGMRDWIVIPSTHSFIPRNKDAYAQTVYFLKNLKFDRAKAK